MLTPEQIKEMRERHRNGPLSDGTPWCDGCDFDWPCDTILALNEVERLRFICETAGITITADGATQAGTGRYWGTPKHHHVEPVFNESGTRIVTEGHVSALSLDHDSGQATRKVDE